MVSLLEAIRAQRDRFIPPTVQQRSTQGTNKAVQQGTTKAQDVVNKNAKGFFDNFPKPADFLLIDRKKQDTAFKDMNLSVRPPKDFSRDEFTKLADGTKLIKKKDPISNPVKAVTRNVGVRAENTAKTLFKTDFKSNIKVDRPSVVIGQFLRKEKSLDQVFKSFGFKFRF